MIAVSRSTYFCSPPTLGFVVFLLLTLAIKSLHSSTVQVAILEKLKGDPSTCQLYDYGVDENCYYLVLKHYPCSLKEWRLRHEARRVSRTSRGSAEPFRGALAQEDLALYLEVFAAVLEAAQRMAEKGIIHFDLKCDNVLLEPLPGVSEERFWAPSESGDVSAVEFATEKASTVDFEADPSTTSHVSAGQTPEDRVEAATASADQKSATDRNECPSKTPTLESVAASQSVNTRSQAPVSKPQSLATRSASLSIKDMLSTKFRKSRVSNQVTGHVVNQLNSQVKGQVSDGVKSRVALPFRVVLADFGQSKICRQSDVSGGITVRNRGTEFVKSPEMLTVFNAARACNAGGLKKVRISGSRVLMWRPDSHHKLLLCVRFFEVWRRRRHVEYASTVNRRFYRGQTLFRNACNSVWPSCCV